MSTPWQVYRNAGHGLRSDWWVALPPPGAGRRREFSTWREAFDYADRQARHDRRRDEILAAADAAEADQ